tara:strand:+ start:2982 stop:3566 length:585 start_codon:yes stop_codon:yes gene_type:complete
LKTLVDFKRIIEKIHHAQLTTIMPLTEFRNKNSTDKLPSESRGLYWLWCKTDFTKIALKTTEKGSAHVPLDVLFSTRNGLDHVCKKKYNEFVIVYNGIGGFKTWKKGSTYGLRARINQECVSKNTKTGTLNIEARGLSPEDWMVSYFNFEDEKNDTILKHLDPHLNKAKLYENMANTLEILWRLRYGTPIFCRH